MIEGPDDTGKTTLAKGLERRGWTYLHADGRSTLPTYAEQLSHLQDHANVVLDRAHLGEMVHGPLDRGTEPSMGWFKLIEAFLLEKEARGVLLLTRPGPPHQWENDIFRHATLGGLFSEMATFSSLYWSGWPDPMPRDLTFGIGEGPDEIDPDWTQDRIDPEGLGGGISPEVWILAEQQNPNAKVPWPLATKCGIDLVWPVVMPKLVRVSNAYPSSWRQNVANPFDDLHARWRALGKPAVVTLGRQTRAYCQMADVEVSTALPHPQWHLRFQSKTPEVYRYHLGMAILNAQRAGV